MDHRNHYVDGRFQFLIHPSSIELRNLKDAGYNRETIIHVPGAQDMHQYGIRDMTPDWNRRTDELSRFAAYSEAWELLKFADRYPELFKGRQEFDELRAKELLGIEEYNREPDRTPQDDLRAIVNLNPTFTEADAARINNFAGFVEYGFADQRSMINAYDDISRAIIRRVLPVKVAQTGATDLSVVLGDLERLGATSLDIILRTAVPRAPVGFRRAA